MKTPSVRCVLVAPSRPPQRRPTRPPGAVAGTINLAAVATTAHHDLGTAAGAQEKPYRYSLAAAASAQNRWTNATIAGILTLHACPARCGARRRVLTAKFRSAPCLPFDQGKLLPASPRPRQPCIFRQPSPPTPLAGGPHHRVTTSAPDLGGFRPPSTSEHHCARLLPLDHPWRQASRLQISVPKRPLLSA
jgi:hypothetical protein